MLMTSYLSSNFIRAEDLEENVVIETTIIDVQSKEFEEKNGDVSVKPVIYTEDGRGVASNQTRLKVAISAWAPNSDNWIGKPIRIRRGATMFAGKSVACIVLEPVVAARIEALRRGKLTITSGSKSTPATEAASSLGVDIDDSIPFN